MFRTCVVRFDAMKFTLSVRSRHTPPAPGTSRLAAQDSLGAYLARHAGHFARERVELLHHRVDGVLQLEDLAARVDGDLARQVAERHGRRHVGDVSHLRRQVRRHVVHAVGQILPRTGDARHVGLTAQSSFRTHLARHARHFAGEAARADPPSC